jgi:hypothetical protein
VEIANHPQADQIEGSEKDYAKTEYSSSTQRAVFAPKKAVADAIEKRLKEKHDVLILVDIAHDLINRQVFVFSVLLIRLERSRSLRTVSCCGLQCRIANLQRDTVALNASL